MEHFIYHIFNKKIGVTTDVVRRMKQQNVNEGEYEIIEKHTNAKTASYREIELQKEYNYPVDKILYWKTLKNAKKAYNSISQAKRVANTNYKLRILNIDYKKRNIDFIKKAKKCEKPISQFDLQGNFVKDWNSAKQAEKELNLSQGGISQCCKGKQKMAYGYLWKHK